MRGVNKWPYNTYLLGSPKREIIKMDMQRLPPCGPKAIHDQSGCIIPALKLEEVKRVV